MAEQLPLWFRQEVEQSRQEGRQAAAIESLRLEAQSAGEDTAWLREIARRMRAVPVTADFPFTEPDDLAAIRALRDEAPRRYALPYGDDGLYDRQYGAWLGRCVGCALGKPTETFMGPDQIYGDISKDRIKTYLTAIAPDEYPLRDYFPEHSPAEAETTPLWCPQSTREHIAFMETDDDIRYTVIGLMILRAHGAAFTTDHVADTWLSHLPVNMTCTAENQAYRNLLIQETRGDWAWVATHDNPWREWIGAAIRADAFGYAAPGMPELAADFAWRDARMSHVKNGIYGEMFAAAMIAAAFALDDPLAIVEAGLAEIPRTSRLHAEMRWTIDLCRRHDFRADAFEAVHAEIYRELGHYHPVHTNNNAALVVSGLLLGGRDFDKVVTITVMGGLDTDCTGATAGSIAGAMLGAQALPAKWTAPLRDTLYSAIPDYHPIAISACAGQSTEVAQRVLRGA